MLAAQVRRPGGLQVVVAGLKRGLAPLRALTPAGRIIGFPCWSPDGRWIAAEENKHGGSTLVVVPSAGGEIRTIASEFTHYFTYDWSPDSDRILFAGLRNGVWNIYIGFHFRPGKVASNLTAHFSTFNRDSFATLPGSSERRSNSCSNANDLMSNIYIADLNPPDK